MPKVQASPKYFFEILGTDLDVKKLEDICFEFGLELEYDQETDEFTFEVPSNRCDLVCVEGLAQAIGSFIGLKTPPVYKMVEPTTSIRVSKNTREVRPVVVAAILRNVKFDEAKLKSFIDFQDKLHENICRKRTLVSMGTHDLDKIKAPFLYDARKPEDIRFVPLNQKVEMNGKELMEFYKTDDSRIKNYLHIIEKSPLFPIFYDANGVVLSLPPIINGDHSKITVETKNIFIEITATDQTKAVVVLNTLTSLFSSYCDYTVEQVQVLYENEEPRVYPNLSEKNLEVDTNYVNNLAGVELSSEEMSKLLLKMNFNSKIVTETKLEVRIPVTRSDILHPCDIAEDVAIAFGYNNVEDSVAFSTSFGCLQPLNKYSDLLRLELSSAGYRECLNFTLCSLAEIGQMLNKTNFDENAVLLSNAKTQDFQVVRTTLIPGLLRTIVSNKSNKVPFQIFEVGDIVIKSKNEVGAKNVRKLAALHTDTSSSGFELIHGLLDIIMRKLGIKLDKSEGYTIKESNDPTFFPGMQAEIILGEGEVIGIMGILHPNVVKNFGWENPASVLELNIQALIEKILKI